MDEKPQTKIQTSALYLLLTEIVIKAKILTHS